MLLIKEVHAMKKVLILCMCIVFGLAGSALGASRQEMKRMSVFLSNFTEAGLFNFDIRTYADEGEDDLEGEIPLHLGIPNNVTELARFGIVHNLINNYKSRIRKCRDKNCESGPLVIDKKFVAESVRKYFGFDLDAMDLSPIQDSPSVVYSYDGRLYHFDAESFGEPDNDTVYYAEVEDIDEGRYITASGYIYDSKRPSRKAGTFSAFVIPSKWQGKDSWLIVSMTTDWRN